MKKKRGRPKREIKKEIKEKNITCQYCEHYQKDIKFCKTYKKEIPPDHDICDSFIGKKFFYCIKNHQIYNILTCISRYNCVKHKVRFYSSYSKCRRCTQRKIIKKIAEKEDLYPKQVSKPLKRREKTEPSKIRRRNKTTITRREKLPTIRRREKPKPRLRRRNHGKQSK
jgi:hypothetical protein